MSKTSTAKSVVSRLHSRFDEICLEIEKFATNEMSVLLFPYNPAFASNELKKFVEENNAQDHLVWGSAFPGPMSIDGTEIKPVHMWKEGGEFDFAVIIPSDDQ